MPADPAIEAAAKLTPAQAFCYRKLCDGGRIYRYSRHRNTLEALYRRGLVRWGETPATQAWAYLAAQPGERTAEEMRREVDHGDR